MTHRSGDVPRSPGSRRGMRASAVALVAAGSCLFPIAAARAAEPHVPAAWGLVELKQDHVARAAPDAAARRIERVAVRRPLTGVRTVLPVLGSAVDTEGGSWLRVRLPGRPNGHRGWIRAEQVRSRSTAWHITLDISERRVRVYRDGSVERRFRAVVGNPSTPTPRGRFFIEETVALSSTDFGGPFALAASARSPVLQEFAGGPGQIALHGTDNLAGALGTAVSHGCIRLSTSAITWLARRIGGGVPLTIVR